MLFFSNEIASTLQYFTFPLEVVGLSLAVIEIRFPQLAQLISKQVSIAATRISIDEEHTTKIIHQRIEKAGFLGKLIMRDLFDKPVTLFQFRFLQLWIPIFLGISAVIVLPRTYSIITYGWNSSHPDAFVIEAYVRSFTRYPFLLLMIVGFLVMFVHLTSLRIVSMADKFVEGRAVGTLGIIIAGFGVLGEAYQFTTQLVV